MRTLRLLPVLMLSAAFIASTAVGSHQTEDAQELVDDALDQVDLPSTPTSPLPGEEGDSDASGQVTGDAGLAAGVIAAVTYVGDVAQAAGDGLLDLGLGLVASVFGVFSAGGHTASAAVASVSAAPSQSTVIATVVAALVGSGLGLLGLAQRYGSVGAIPLFSRIAKSELLDNKARAQIFDLIKENPGINVSEISRRLDIAWGTATHHLQKLRAERLIAIRRVANQKCYFQNGGSYTPDEMDVMSATKNTTARRIAEFLVDQGPICHQDIAQSLEISPALVSFHMRKLLEAGVVEKERQGRRTIFTAAVETLRPAPRPSAAH